MSKKLKHIFNTERLETVENVYCLPSGTLTENKISKCLSKDKRDDIQQLCTTLCSLVAAKRSLEDKSLNPFDEFPEFEPGMSPFGIVEIESIDTIYNAIGEVLDELAQTCGHAV